jgi:wyosine [tRNA(Phe)-imidazoG37] synthetase (radical SAM superfamily)
LGISLGVNLLPKDAKVCSFDCLYCECGWNKDHKGGRFPDADAVMEELEAKLKEEVAEGRSIDVITFAGNGEPTLHPDFDKVIDRTIELRDQYYPNAKVSVLSNATRMTDPKVHAALLKVDNNILKIDGAFDETIHLIDQPNDKNYSVRYIVEGMKSFKGQLIVQTMFVRGMHEGKVVDNTTPEEVSAWCDLMREIRPHQIMVYSLDRPTPEPNLVKVSKEEMAQFVAPLVAEGFNVSIA